MPLCVPVAFPLLRVVKQFEPSASGLQLQALNGGLARRFNQLRWHREETTTLQDFFAGTSELFRRKPRDDFCVSHENEFQITVLRVRVDGVPQGQEFRKNFHPPEVVRLPA